MALDLKKISKAIAGGIAATAAGSGTAFVVIPTGVGVPSWAYAAVPLVNFIIGFAVVYWAPANKPANP